MTIRYSSLSLILPPRACAGPRWRDARRACARTRHARAPASRLAAACLAVALGAGVDSAQARKPRPPRAASAPSTAQILGPSAATVPDALPPDRNVYRCGDSYSARPCAPAQQALDVADARTDAQRRQSESLTARDKRLADWYQAGRRERDTVPSAPTRGRAAAPAPTCTSTNTMTCVPKKPRTRTVSVAGPASAAVMGMSKN